MLKCVMFDVSGTLVDSDNALITTDRKFLVPWLNRNGYEIDFPKIKALREKYPGKKFYINLLREMRWKMKKTMFREMIQLFLDFYFLTLEPFEGVEYTLRHLRKKKLHLFVVSNSKRKYVDKSLEKLDFDFDKIISHEKTKSRKSELKPFKYLLERNFLKPGECLMVGDRLDEDAFSRKLGIRFVWFPRRKNPTRGEKEEYDYIIRRFGELKNIINSLVELK